MINFPNNHCVGPVVLLLLLLEPPTRSSNSFPKPSMMEEEEVDDDVVFVLLDVDAVLPVGVEAERTDCVGVVAAGAAVSVDTVIFILVKTFSKILDVALIEDADDDDDGTLIVAVAVVVEGVLVFILLLGLGLGLILLVEVVLLPLILGRFFKIIGNLLMTTVRDELVLEVAVVVLVVAVVVGFAVLVLIVRPPTTFDTP
jgi:hypothetical protein